MAKTHNYIVGQLFTHEYKPGIWLFSRDDGSDSPLFDCITGESSFRLAMFSTSGTGEYLGIEDVFPLFPEGTYTVWVEGIYPIPVELSWEIAKALRRRFSDVVIYNHYPGPK